MLSRPDGLNRRGGFAPHADYRFGSAGPRLAAAARGRFLLTHKNNLVSFLHATRTVAPMLVVPVTLLLSAVAFGQSFDGPYVLLAFVSAAIAHIVLGPSFKEDEFEAGAEFSAAGRLLIGWGGVVGLLLGVGYAAEVLAFFSRPILFLWFLLAGAALVFAHTAIRRFARRVMSLPEFARSAVIAGVNEASNRLAAVFGEHAEFGMRVQGFFEDRSAERLHEPLNGSLLGKLRDLPDYVRRHKIDVIFIALPIRHIQRVMDLLDELHDSTASIYFVPDVFVFDLIQSRVHSFHGLPAIALRETPFYGYRGLAKRVFDIVLAVLFLVLLAPVLLMIAIAIRFGSPGSVIFRQRRYGIDGREIVIYKFRTMYVSEDGDCVVQAKRGDARVTPVGRVLRKYSLDELPQLVNVIQGRMSFVGPRPHAVVHNEQYRKLIKGYMIRHKVLPGITGWAQVNGCRGETSDLNDMRKRVEYDLEYLRNWSLAFDVKILFMTARAVLNTDKAY